MVRGALAAHTGSAPRLGAEDRQQISRPELGLLHVRKHRISAWLKRWRPDRRRPGKSVSVQNVEEVLTHRIRIQQVTHRG
tara:strand:+ start:296 stop:535 length:240 start_codon:yes stop_codon:yes gene_type:complete